MATKQYHMSCNIQGLLDNSKGKKITYLSDDKGNKLSDQEAREELSRLQSLGHKLFSSGECDGFDPFGGGCPGHETN